MVFQSEFELEKVVEQLFEQALEPVPVVVQELEQEMVVVLEF